ncbi:MAG: LLM class flavin-dependent oxidoreductase [Thermoleophilia bacterium]|nr:LLM class flavin-dependent oxidoreductase [Thermoleophilia bacterium]
MGFPLSVLDLSPVASDSSGPEALTRSVELARRCEELGYARYWVAEHHNTPGLASSAPEIMVAHIAASTSRIRVGSGGIMLPNHPPLRIAESFRVLESLHPGRIDLGIGRAPGADPMTAFALRRSQDGFSVELPSLIAELLAYVDGGFPEDHPFARVRAMPLEAPLPPMWILGSSEESAHLAAQIGAGYAFAHYMGPRRAAGAMRAYRDSFRPSPSFAEPHAMLGLSVICAETTEHAEFLSWSSALGLIRMRSGRPGALPTPEEGLAHDYSPHQQDQLSRFRRAQVLGDPTSVAQRVRELVDDTAADEAIVMTSVHGHDERVRSYELLAEQMGLTTARVASATTGA